MLVVYTHYTSILAFFARTVIHLPLPSNPYPRPLLNTPQTYCGITFYAWPFLDVTWPLSKRLRCGKRANLFVFVGNYATDVAAGASYRFKLLFIILMSNFFAVFLQSLCIKLGSVTGMNLAENCKAHLPPWLNYLLYFFAESAIIATDIAEVIHLYV